MKKFTKNELISILWIFLFLLVISVPNFNLSIKRARDSQRRDALGKITDFLKDFHDRNSGYPLATDDGRIIGCNEQTIDEIVTYSPCEWDKDFPPDPQKEKGITFRYSSNGSLYQILGYLEVTDAGSEYQKVIANRKIMCGSKICNTGRASFRTPLDISVEEYQNKLDCENGK